MNTLQHCELQTTAKFKYFQRPQSLISMTFKHHTDFSRYVNLRKKSMTQGLSMMHGNPGLAK